MVQRIILGVIGKNCKNPQKVKLLDPWITGAFRAAVITSVSAVVIAFASDMRLPVSTTYVSFAAVVSTDWAGKIFQRGDAQLKLGRAIWLVTCCFFSAFFAAISTGFCSFEIKTLGTFSLEICLVINLTTRWFMMQRSDKPEERLQQEATEHWKKFVDDSTCSEQILFVSKADSPH